ncbi:GCG_CRPN prefix-to-repeats domain-containing protein [Labrys miyagiensis]|uniref:GCG_CRPN prefix-to-repeats domain-containing protein n=1 Tax=Labrys miyagiensis TaxID=346912 RepID=UPI003D67D734
MRIAIATLLAVAGLTTTAETASALSPVPVTQGAQPLVENVRYGCGYGWHPNYWGRCVPDDGYGYVPRRPAYYYEDYPRHDNGRHRGWYKHHGEDHRRWGGDDGDD